MKLYCKEIGIEYQDHMVNWRPLSSETAAEWEPWRNWVGTAMGTSGFLKSTPKPIEDLTTLPEEVQRCMEEAMVPYTKLHAKRLQ